MATGPIEYETRKLLENLRDGLHLLVLSYSTKGILKLKMEYDLFEITDKQAQPG
jgi:hypothetical protein